MTPSGLARACAAAALLTTVATACGDDDDPVAGSTTTTTTAAAGTDTTAGGAPASTTTTTAAVRTIEVSFAGGRVSGGVRTERVALGETVRLRVTSDVADEVHVHTYDLIGAVGPDMPADIEVDATIPGRHEVELEDRGRVLMTLEVS
jgi:hypothetical protein